MKPSPLTPTANAYYKQFTGGTFVIKVGGKPLDNADTCQGILESVKQFREHGIACVLVHGGGAQLDHVLGASPKHPDTQLRITPPNAMAAVERAREDLSQRVWGICNNIGLPAEVLDPSVTTAERIITTPDHGATGRVKSVSRREIMASLARGNMPIIPFGGRDASGRYWNTNADDNAGRAAAALEASKLILLTTTDGVERPGKRGNGGPKKISFLDSDRLATLLRTQVPDDQGGWRFVVGEGMFPKLRAAQRAIDSGKVGAVHILRADGSALLNEVLTRTGSGTMIQEFQSLSIDVATQDDVDDIEVLLGEAQKFTTPKGTPYLKARPRADIVADLPTTLVFEFQGVPVGTICYTRVPQHPGTVLIRSFAIAENHQSSQYGRVLLEACLDRIREEGFLTAVSITAAEQLQHLYRSYGGVKDAGRFKDVLAPSLARYDQSERDSVHLYAFDMTPATGTEGAD